MAIVIATTPVVASATSSSIVAGTRNIPTTTTGTTNTGATTGTTTGTSGTSSTNTTSTTVAHPSMDTHGCEQTVWTQQSMQDKVEVIMKGAERTNPSVVIEDMKKNASAGQCLAGMQQILDVSIHIPQIGGSIQGMVKRAVIENIKKMVVAQQKLILERVCKVADSALRTAFGGIITTIEDINKVTQGLENADEALEAVIGHQVGRVGGKVTEAIHKQIDRLDDSLQKGAEEFSNATTVNNKELDDLVKKAEEMSVYTEQNDEKGKDIHVSNTTIGTKVEEIGKKADELNKKAENKVTDVTNNTAKKAEETLGGNKNIPEGAQTTVPSNTANTGSSNTAPSTPATNTGTNTGATTQPVQPSQPAQSQPRVAGTTMIQ